MVREATTEIENRGADCSLVGLTRPVADALIRDATSSEIASKPNMPGGNKTGDEAHEFAVSFGANARMLRFRRSRF
jgi:hypothetical protein